MMNLTKLAQGDRAQSRWLTNAAQTALYRDPVDALNDAEALVAALKADVDALLGPQFEEDIAKIDRWNNAALAGVRGEPCPAQDVDSLDGYRHGLEQRKVQVVMPPRPEGYYHMAPDGDA